MSKYVNIGLAQLVERLAHRYSESTSSNPGNLTSTTVCGDRTGCVPATKRSASVAPEVDLGECTLHLPPQKVNKAEPTLALNPRGDVTRNPKQGYQWRTSRTYLKSILEVEYCLQYRCYAQSNFFLKVARLKNSAGTAGQVVQVQWATFLF